MPERFVIPKGAPVFLPQVCCCCLEPTMDTLPVVAAVLVTRGRPETLNETFAVPFCSKCSFVNNSGSMVIFTVGLCAAAASFASGALPWWGTLVVAVAACGVVYGVLPFLPFFRRRGHIPACRAVGTGTDAAPGTAVLYFHNPAFEAALRDARGR
ncbi:MAG: hypothetical protein HY553_06030 [Elusimicrobia bacterium]|nr:hypothetical protein [Elusimicrobiota bacterium]